MRLKQAVSIGEKCGCKTVNECIRSLEINNGHIHKYDIIISDLYLEVEDLSKMYDDKVLNWTIKEYNTYER